MVCTRRRPIQGQRPVQQPKEEAPMNTAAPHVNQPTANTNKTKTDRERNNRGQRASPDRAVGAGTLRSPHRLSKVAPNGLSWRRSWNGNLKVKTLSALPATTMASAKTATSSSDWGFPEKRDPVFRKRFTNKSWRLILAKQNVGRTMRRHPYVWCISEIETQ